MPRAGQPLELTPSTLTIGQQVHTLHLGRFLGSSILPLPVLTVKIVGRKYVTLSDGQRIALDGDGFFGACDVTDPIALKREEELPWRQAEWKAESQACRSRF